MVLLSGDVIININRKNLLNKAFVWKEKHFPSNRLNGVRISLGKVNLCNLKAIYTVFVINVVANP